MFIAYPIIFNLHTIFTEPRYASLPNIMTARKKPIEKITAHDLGIVLTPQLEVLRFQDPPKRVGGVKVSGLEIGDAALLKIYFKGGKCR